MTEINSIVWFRYDLRVNDNPALNAACKNSSVLPIYIFDNKNFDKFQMGSASRWWLHHSLIELNKSLNSSLSIYIGDPIRIIKKIIEKFQIKNIYWNRCYDPNSIRRDKDIKNKLTCDNINIFTFNGSVLWEPWTILKDDKTPYKVFTPYYKKGCLNAAKPRPPIDFNNNSVLHKDNTNSIDIDGLNLLDKKSWYLKFHKYWKPGEKKARDMLNNFLSTGINDYKEGRNFPSKKNVSKLSPYIHFGEISVNQIWYAILNNPKLNNDKNVDHFLSELGWREFSNYLLYHFPKIVDTNLQAKFDKFPWVNDKNYLNCWQKGQTGYPIVDAGMRELWKTGYMHNRVRMIVGSFLVKNLLIDWRKGEEWFWDCLLDADLASNSASWQWVAGSGADAAPYFRIFNPILQAKKFDPNGDYIKQFLPVLRGLPNKYLFSPWEAPENILEKSNIILGKNYPKPIIDIKLSRDKALDLFKQISN
ncbi:MAG: deoxyribodipyrimidine photolyase [Rhodospirillaceae bacterium]|nr:deoxyribodipyrimidine photolyase [Rhodospirillaceae bacterium]|tara:strand:+ start:22283 stop:23707 length:1425 start_codon:yes stop_codon:yes gene_type:complete